MDPTRMTRYSISNEGTGPYAAFTCDRCNREYRSTPSIAAAVKQNVTRSAFGGFLRNIPVVGDAVAQQVEGDPYRIARCRPRSSPRPGDRWRQYFRECPTCHEIVCVPDFDEVTGFCDDDSPRRAEIEAAQAQQAAATLQGRGGRVRHRRRHPARTGRIASAEATQARRPLAAGAGSARVRSCGTALAPGARFCASCGTPVAQVSVVLRLRHRARRGRPVLRHRAAGRPAPDTPGCTTPAAYHGRRATPRPERSRTGSRARRARTCSSTPMTRSTGTRGAARRWSAPGPSTGRSSCRSGTPRATGVTSCIGSRSRTPRPRSDLERGLREHQGRPRGATGRRFAVHGRRPVADRQRRLADERVPDPRRTAVLRRHLLPGHSSTWPGLVPPGPGGRP